MKKAESQRIDVFELWYWRRLLRVPSTARRLNKSILKEISPKYLLEVLMLKLELQCFGYLMRRTDSLMPYIDMNPPQVYMCSPSWTPLPPPSPSHPSGSSQCTSPEHPVSCIERGLAICFTYDNIHVSMPFSQTIPPLPSPTESKRLFYTSVSLLLSRIQGYYYHLSKFHIYLLVYCIGVFLSGFTLYNVLTVWRWHDPVHRKP